MICVLWLTIFGSDSFLKPEPDLVGLQSASILTRFGPGHLFVLDRNRAVIHRYDRDGLLLDHFGGRGSGPGEFSRPGFLYSVGNRVFVVDQRRTLVFDAKGSHESTLVHDSYHSYHRRTVNGWAFFEKRGFDTDEIALIHRSDVDSENTVLATWTITPENPLSRHINPVRDHSVLKVGRKADTIYVAIENLEDIFWFRVSDQKGGIFALDLKAIPFDRDYGQRILSSRQKAAGRDLTADFPEFFPPISDIAITHSGILRITRWFSPLDIASVDDTYLFERGLIIFLDPTGERVAPTWLDLYDWLIVDVTADHVIHLRYDEDQDLTRVVRTALPRAKNIVRDAALEISRHYSTEIMR